MVARALAVPMRAIGLLAAAVPEDKLDNHIAGIVAEHLEAAPGAVAETKRLIRYVSSNNIADSMIYTADRLADAWETEEGQAGVSAFLEKRRPPWRSGA